jgi:hypothetical protein
MGISELSVVNNKVAKNQGGAVPCDPFAHSDIQQ